MKRVCKMLALLLALVLTVGMVPTAMADEPAAWGPVNYVVILDVSPSTEETDDKEVMEQAGKMIADLLPVENAQLGVITFGYQDSAKAYRFRVMKPSFDTDVRVVRELLPLRGTADKSEKDAVIKILDEVDQLALKADAQSIKGQSPVGLSIMAAVDMLKRADSAKNNACIIVISDGVRTSANATRGDYSEIETVAAKEAKAMGWPIYCLRLTGESKKITDEQRTNAKTDMGNTVKTTGAYIDANGNGTFEANEKGAYDIHDLDDISLAIMQIIAQYSGGEIMTIELDENGYASKQFDIPELTAEATTTVTGVDLKKVCIKDEADNILCVAEGNEEVPNKYLTTKRKGSIEDYIIAKLIAPDKTKATVEVYGKANATVHALISTSKGVQMNLDVLYKEADAAPSEPWIEVDADTTLKKDCLLRFEAFFTYADHHYKGCTAYTEAVPTLTVHNVSSGSKLPTTLQMSGNESGFYLEMAMSDFGMIDSIYEACAEVSHATLDGGSLKSNPVGFKTKDIVSNQIGDFNTPLTAGLNEDIEIALAPYIENPDGDKLACSIVCESNSKLSFAVLDSASDVLKFNSGMVNGEHQLLIKLADPAGPVHELHLPLIVEMQEFEGGTPIRLLAESDHFPDSLNFMLGKVELPTSTSADISEAFYINGLNVEIAEASAENDSVAVCENNGTWLVRGVGAGNTVVELKLTAEILNDDGTLRIFDKALDVEVVSRWSIFWSIWGLWIGLFLFALAVLFIALHFRRKGRGLKNLWNVTVSTQSGEVYKCTHSIDLYEYSGETEITMLRLMEDQIMGRLDVLNNKYSTKSAAVRNVINYWKENDGLNQMKLVATYKPSGFEAELVKGAANISMLYDDEPVKGSKIHVGDRELKVVFAEGDNRLLITMLMTSADDED